MYATQHTVRLDAFDMKVLANISITGDMPETAAAQQSVKKLKMMGFCYLFNHGRIKPRLTDHGLAAVHQYIKEKESN